MSKFMEKVAEKIANSLMKCSEDARHSIMAGIFVILFAGGIAGVLSMFTDTVIGFILGVVVIIFVILMFTVMGLVSILLEAAERPNSTDANDGTSNCITEEVSNALTILQRVCKEADCDCSKCQLGNADTGECLLEEKPGLVSWNRE